MVKSKNGQVQALALEYALPASLKAVGGAALQGSCQVERGRGSCRSGASVLLTLHIAVPGAASLHTALPSWGAGLSGSAMETLIRGIRCKASVPGPLQARESRLSKEEIRPYHLDSILFFPGPQWALQVTKALPNPRSQRFRPKSFIVLTLHLGL